MITVLTVSAAGVAGGGAGWLATPLTAAYCGPAGPRRRLALGVLSGVVLALFGWRFGAGPEFVAFAYFGVVGSLLAVIDIAVKRLPDRFTLPSYGIGIGLLAVAAGFVDAGPNRLANALLGMAGLWFCYALQHLIRPASLGRGDVKLSGVIGLYLGWLGQAQWMIGVLAGMLLGGLFGVSLLILGLAERKDQFSFGPFMLAGALAGIMVGGSA